MNMKLPSPLFLITFSLLAAFMLGSIFGISPFESRRQADIKSASAKQYFWPNRPAAAALSPVLQRRLDYFLLKMTLEQKVGQLIIADINALSPEDLERYPLGAILAGGNSAPDGQRFADAESWLSFADALYAAAKRADHEVFVPPLFGIDAVHGHNNVSGAVIFPHNVGLGAANDQALTKKIGAATARALAATGHDWTFAPTVAVAQDARWGRTYESFSADPMRVKNLTAAFVDGVQSEKIGTGMVLATAKHFIADGGTQKGKDQGDAILSEAELVGIHAPGFIGALDAGVSTVMASYSSWNGKKLHGHRYLLQTILKERLSFDGFVVGDWDAHAQLEGCSASNCPAAINAGVDMLMAPTEWKQLYLSLLDQVKEGVISPQRLDDAVRRILTVKFKSGLLDSPAPSRRLGAGEASAIDSPYLRDLARQAVRASQVLLKNTEETLPIRNVSSIAVIGDGADNFPAQCGGWCLSWQSDGLPDDKFDHGETILDGIIAHADQRNISVNFVMPETDFTPADIAIVVFYVKPYAEYYGDAETLALPDYNEHAIRALQHYQKNETPVISILVSGRPLWTAKYLDASSAFLASWLPGTEGGGVADILFGKTLNGDPVIPQGRLPFPWLDDNTFASTIERPAIFDVGFGLDFFEGSASPISYSQQALPLAETDLH